MFQRPQVAETEGEAAARGGGAMEDAAEEEQFEEGMLAGPENDTERRAGDEQEGSLGVEGVEAAEDAEDEQDQEAVED